MSHTTPANKNKNHKISKVNFQQYLFDPKEPIESIFADSPSALEAELITSRYTMKRRFRYIAQKMRNIYS